MILKRRVSLYGVELDELDPRIVITGIDEAEGRDEITAVSVAGGSGQRITNRRRESLDVTVRFAMDIPKTRLQERAALMEKVKKWASGGGRQRVNYRPQRRLFVVLAQAPGEGDLFRWTNDYALVFRAYQVPYWTDENEVAVSSSINAGASFPIEVPGSAETVADFVITNGSGALIKKLSVKIGNSEMQFNGDNLLPAGQVIYVDHPENVKGLNIMRAYNQNGSVMKWRTGANDFYCQPGSNTVTFTAERAVRVLARVRGRYL